VQQQREAGHVWMWWALLRLVLVLILALAPALSSQSRHIINGTSRSLSTQNEPGIESTWSGFVFAFYRGDKRPGGDGLLLCILSAWQCTYMYAYTRTGHTTRHKITHAYNKIKHTSGGVSSYVLHVYIHTYIHTYIHPYVRADICTFTSR